MNTSDRFCKQSCGLMLGCSDAFKKYLDELKKLNQKQENIPFKLFDTLEKQQKFQSILTDDTIKTLSLSAKDIQIFQKALEGMERNYSEILTGEKRHMFVYPSMFCYDSRIDCNETLNPELLEKRQRQLENTENSTNESKKSLEEIKNYLRRIKPQLCEQEFFDAFVTLFYSHRGICIHSLKMDAYLSIFIEKAQKERKSNKSLGFGLTALEKSIAKVLNISKDELNSICDKVTEHLKETGKMNDGKGIVGSKIHQAIDDVLEDDDKRLVKSKFKVNKKYSTKEVYGGIRLAKFESICKFAGENDLLIMLPDQKLIVCIEIKQHMTSFNELPKNDRMDRNLKSAASQLRKNVEYISRVHGKVFSTGWDFVKLAAISPRVHNMHQVCESCQRFIITSDIFKEHGAIEKWWKSTGLDGRKVLNPNARKNSYNDYLKFFNRIVNLSAVRFHPDPFQNWKQIQGDKTQHMSAGHTSSSSDMSSPEDFEFCNVLQHAHDFYKVICLNEDQEAILSCHSYFAVFFNDFGSGMKY